MNVIVYFLGVFLRLFHFLTNPLYDLLAKEKRKIPPIKNDLLKISACDLAEKIRLRQIPCVEVCRAYIERIKEVNPIINAIAEHRFRQALKDAKTVDDYLAKCSLNCEDLRKIKPLLGVPLTVKESCSLQGLSLAAGILDRKGYKAERDSELVSRLKMAGAIPLLVSTTPELCCSWESHSLLNGTTCNAYDSRRSAGGSSGGEGALLGAGASLIGIGSDIAGSIRVPAMFNGVFGHKPSARMVPNKGHFPYVDNNETFSDLLVLGPMCRYAKDLKLVMKVICGKKYNDLRLNEDVDLKKLKVFYVEETEAALNLPKVQPEIKEAVIKCVQFLKKNGAQLNDYKFNMGDNLAASAVILNASKDIPNLLKPRNANLFIEMLKSLAGYGNYSFNVLFYYLIEKSFNTLVGNYSAEVGQMRAEYKDILGSNGVLICPTWIQSADKHHQFYFTISSLIYIVPANLCGLPSTQVPCGFDANGLPIGVQVIAGPNQDRLCLAVAEALEKRFKGWQPPT